jgi:hypothetical protein
MGQGTEIRLLRLIDQKKYQLRPKGDQYFLHRLGKKAPIG